MRVEERRTKRFALPFLASLLVLTAGCGDGADEPAPTATEAPDIPLIRVAVQPTPSALPVAVADREGFFEAHGLDVEWEVPAVTISELIATLGREFDVAMGVQPALITAVDEGLSVVVITGGSIDTDEAPDRTIVQIVSSPDSGITSWQDLEGQTGGSLTLTGNIHYSTLYTLYNEGVDFKSINWVVGTVPELPGLLQAGQVSFIQAIEPSATRAAAEGAVIIGNPYVATRARDDVDRTYVGYWLAERSWADENEEIVLAYNRALADASDWIEGHIEESRQILAEFTRLEGDTLLETPIPMFSFQTTPEELASVLALDLEVWLEILQTVGEYTGDHEPHDFLPSWVP